MKIATWNINSARARLDHLVQWLRTFQPDVVLLQEIKVQTELFPAEAILDEGYQSAAAGQKSYNGVAILSKYRIEDVNIGFNSNPLPDEARYIDGLIDGKIRVGSVYIPNGQNKKSEKFPKKLEFLDAFIPETLKKAQEDTPFVLGGDYNIAPKDEDATFPERWKGDVPFTSDERTRYAQLLHNGMYDATRIKHAYKDPKNPSLMTWWDYRAGSFEKDNGLRIDHLLLCPQAADLFKDTGIDRTPRTWEKPSDHTPVWCELSI